jgi:hypothetical protein
MSKEEFRPKKRVVFKTKIYETQDKQRRRKQEYHRSSSSLRMTAKVNVDQVVPSFRITIWVSNPIEAAAQESTIAGLVNADQTNLGIPKALRLRLEAYIAGASDLWDTCFVPHHTAYQPCRGTAYSASAQS